MKPCAGIWDAIAERRARARRLAEQGALRPDVTEAEAADLLWLLTSFDAFDILYTGRSLPAELVAATLITTAERALCRGA